MTTLGLDENRDTPQKRGNGFSISTSEVLKWIIAGLIAWGAINARVAVVEDRVADMREQLVEIRGDVKLLLQRRP